MLVAGLALPFAGVVGMASKNTAEAMTNLPTTLDTQPLAQRTKVLDSRGAVIATFYDQNRVNVPLDKIAPVMRKAILATEDARFYEHGALDLQGTLRAFLTNQASNSTQGGSSITQQLAKMTLVNQAKTKAERKAATEETYQRKIQELRYAIGLEQQNSKDWILERYLNIAYFGDGAYGVQSAAQHFFSVNAADLTPAQAALLAGLVKNPVGYDPTRFPERATARRNVVLQRMAADGRARRSDRPTQISKSKLGIKVKPVTNGCLGSTAPFFCDYVRRYLLSDPALGETEADRNELLNNGGLTIKTTLDLRFQAEADEATRDAVDATDNAIGAVAMVEPGTGNVRAVSQSRPMGRDKDKGQTFLNYVVDSKYGDSNGFQAGSTFKIFVLAAALEQGMSSGTTIRSPHPGVAAQEQLRELRRPLPGLRLLDAAQLHQQRHVQHVLRHPAVGEHLLRPARAAHRPVRPVPPRQGDGRRPDRPRPRAGARLHPRCRGREPAGDGHSATPPSPPAAMHCANRPVTDILEPGQQGLQDLPDRLQAGAARGDRRHDQRHPARGHAAAAASVPRWR